MPEPLVIQLARHTLPLITQAWGLRPEQIHTRPGASEMAHHFLKVELGLSYQEITVVLNGSPSLKNASKRVAKGEDFYDRWPAYHRRYHEVKAALMARFEAALS